MQCNTLILRDHVQNHYMHNDVQALVGEEQQEEAVLETCNYKMRVKEESAKNGLKLNIKKLRLWPLVPSPHGK